MGEPGESNRSVEEMDLEKIGKKDSKKSSCKEIPEDKDKDPEAKAAL